MAFKFGGAKPILPAPTAATRILPDSKETDEQLAIQIRMNEANNNVTDSVIDAPLGADVLEAGDERITENKLSRLIADDFPFDESQLAAINGIVNQRYACLTGAAGTGKTTVTKAIVNKIVESDLVGRVDMGTYFKRATPGTEAYDNLMDERRAFEDGDSKGAEPIPSVACVGFTGRSSQMIKKNFPRDWHNNIMTIHRLLAFGPEYYEDFDPELGEMRNKMRFVPFYTKFNLLPWDVVIIDEAGMVSIDLWNQLWEALKPGCRVIMIGDINQLPPVHGRSIFGFAMTKWPSWELTHIHRQVGVNNSIVDNAWRVLKGQRPESDDYKNDPTWKFAMMPVPEDSALASKKIRAWLAAMNGKAYQPHRDTVITAINAAEGGTGYALGQIPMNRELAIVFNKDNPRYIIDAGRERRQLAVGDKVMATRNDHEAGITNGMTGIITNIEENGAYIGDRHRFGLASEVNAYLNDEDEDEDEGEFTLDEIQSDMSVIQQGMKDAKEKKDRGPASHIVTVRFGEGEHSFELPFATLAEVGSLMVAYVVTCHKMQGGESPLVIIILHQAHKQMLNREWLYTAITRASGKCVVFFTDLGLRAALSKQRIKGATLAQKVKVFQELQTKGITGAAVTVDLPEPESLGTGLQVYAPTMLARKEEESTQVTETGKNNLLAQIAKAKARQHNKVEPEPIRERVVHHHHFYEVKPAPTPTPTPPPTRKAEFIDPKVALRERLAKEEAKLERMGTAAVIPLIALPTPPERKLRSTRGAVETMLRLSLVQEQAQRLLTYTPTVEKGDDWNVAIQKMNGTYQQPSSESVAQVKKPFKFGVKK
jgi:hypothetical protein